MSQEPKEFRIELAFYGIGGWKIQETRVIALNADTAQKLVFGSLGLPENPPKDKGVQLHKIEEIGVVRYPIILGWNTWKYHRESIKENEIGKH